MKPRLSVVLACGLAATALASDATAKTQLFVSGPPETAASGMTVLQVKGAPQDAAWAQVTTFVPSGYTINLGQPTGTRIGSASAQVQLLESGSTAAATGVVLVAGTNDATVQQAATQCTGAPGHAAVWLVRMTASTQTFDIHVYIDPAKGTEVRFGSAKLVFCLPQPYAKALPVYAPLGIKIDDLKTTLSAGVFTNPLFAANNVWRTVVTPWAAGGAARDVAATVETQGLVGVPSSLSLRAQLTTTRRGTSVTNSVLLSGTLLETLRGVAGATISVFATDRNAGTVRTSAAGTFAKRVQLVQRMTFRATATVPTRELPCVDPLPRSFVPAGCVSATRAGYRLRSGSIVVAPRKR
jgi:hypothetical protein